MPDDADLVSARNDGRLRVYSGDLADAKSRREVIAKIASGEPRIDVLFNVAGVSTGAFETSAQGVELNYEVNTVAPYAITHGLLANLEANGSARVVNTSTSGVDYVKGFDPDALAHPKKKFKKLFGAYSDSKLALTLWTKAIAPELEKRKITIVAVDDAGFGHARASANSGKTVLQAGVARRGPFVQRSNRSLFTGRFRGGRQGA